MLDHLYQAHRSEMLGYISQRVGESNAEDILQAAWLKALPKIDADHTAAVGFVWRAIGWELGDHWKRRPTVALVVDVPTDGPDLDTPHDVDAMLTTITALPANHQEAIGTMLAESTTREAGELLGCSHPTVTKRQRAAVVALRVEMQVDCHPGAAGR